MSKELHHAAWPAVLIALLVGSPAWAAVINEDFSAAVAPGTPLSTQWDEANSSSAGGVEYAAGNSPGAGADGTAGAGKMRLFLPAATETDPLNPALNTHLAYGTIPRDPASKKVYFAIDLEKGAGDGTNYVSYEWTRGTDAIIARVFANSNGFQVRTVTNTNTSPLQVLAPGWNRIVLEATYAGAPADSSTVKATLSNDLGTFDLGSTIATTGPLTSTNSAADPSRFWIRRLARGGPGDPVAASEQWADNMQVADTPIPLQVPEPTGIALLGVAALCLRRRRTRSQESEH